MRHWMLAAAVLLAGCSDPAPAQAEDDGFDVEVEVDDSTGAIRGVVVDETITPVAEALVRLTSADPVREATTDAEGRFAFSKVPPGPHILSASKYGHEEVQTSTVVEAGVATPRVVQIQLKPTFTQQPYVSDFSFDGRIVCSYSVSLVVTGINAPCITDYTSIACPGGCAPQLREVQGDTREWEWALYEGWKSHIIEVTWDPSTQGTSDQLGITVSYTGRTASEWFATFESGDPLLGRIDCCDPHPSRQQSDAIPPEGIPNLLTFAGVRGGGQADVSIEQDFQAITHTFYHLAAPEGWSFMAGDERPF